MLKKILIFLIGALVGANILYYLVVRDRPARVEPPVAVTSPPAPAAPVAAAPAAPPARSPPTPLPAAPSNPNGLIVPVAGIAPNQLVDTFTQARGADRIHDAIDIMAPEGTPVFAVADGTVEKLFDSKQGGITLYQFDPTGRYVYYYAHLQRYAPGIVEKKTLRQGELIGYVGYTGNASVDGPHLHFAISELGPEKKWWKATAVNPYPLLGGR